MDKTLLAVITTALSLIQTVVVPLVAKGGSADQINKIIDLLEKLLPALGEQVSALYRVIKDIITALSATPGTPEEQLARLRALDAQVDAAFEAAAAEVDPDAPGAPTA